MRSSCVITTPFGALIVPLAYMMHETLYEARGTGLELEVLGGRALAEPAHLVEGEHLHVLVSRRDVIKELLLRLPVVDHNAEGTDVGSHCELLVASEAPPPPPPPPSRRPSSTLVPTHRAWDDVATGSSQRAARVLRSHPK